MSNYPCPGYQLQQDLEKLDKKLERRLKDLEYTLEKLARQLHGVDVLVMGIQRDVGYARDQGHGDRGWNE